MVCTPLELVFLEQGGNQSNSELCRRQFRADWGSIAVNQYVLEKANQKLLAVYWYQNERRTWAEEFRAKIYMLPDLLRYHRSDVALIRIITPLDSNVDATKSDLFKFVNTAFPLLAERFSTTSVNR